MFWLSDIAMDRLFAQAPDFADWFGLLLRFPVEASEGAMADYFQKYPWRETAPEGALLAAQTLNAAHDVFERIANPLQQAAARYWIGIMQAFQGERETARETQQVLNPNTSGQDSR